MSDRFQWLSERGISVEDGFGYTGGEEKYASALQRYFRGYETNRKAVEELLAAGDIDGYAIKVHALKSNSRMIGANSLADAFEALELAAKRGDKGCIDASTSQTLEQYAELIELLRPIGEAETVRAPGEMSSAEARETAELLLAALDDFDDERSAELAAKLAGYPFRPTQKDKLREAARYIGDFMYDEAAELIREIAPAIE
ncbi:MAG: Hpt domain-containing protein [Oscillospiraceae bacterium]|nr:Hpt domain-containing protein [Oscillospiraceae bacterium]